MRTGTAKDRILQVLEDGEGPLCDDCLVGPAEVSRRNYVYHVCQQLQESGDVNRRKERCVTCGKVKNVTWLDDLGKDGQGGWSHEWRFPRSRWPLEEHLSALDEGFAGYIGACGEDRIFTGPSVYFYERVVQETRDRSSPGSLMGDSSFHELVYATLTSWGMHRMGPGGAKLGPFDAFSAGLDGIIEAVGPWWGESILEIDYTEAQQVAEELGKVVEIPSLIASEAPLVTNAKTLHFLLPDLVPPIDRSYTGRFFYGPNTGRMLPGPAADRFEHMYNIFYRLADRNKETLHEVTGESYLCHGHAKGLDNAILGYVRTHEEIFD